MHIEYSSYPIKKTLNIKNANVTVIVSNMDNAVNFYTEMLGLKLSFRTGNDYAVLLSPGLTIGLNPIQRGLESGRCDSLSIGFQVDNLNDAMAELKGRGVVFSLRTVIEGPNKIAFFTDRDKNPLYLIEYRINRSKSHSLSLMQFSDKYVRMTPSLSGRTATDPCKNVC